MLDKFNLLVTTFRYREFDAIDEILDLLDDFGDDDPIFDVTNVSGLVTGITHIDSFQAIEKLKELVRAEEWRFRYVLRVIPIELVADSNPAEIALGVVDLSKKKMISSDSFRLTVEKRHNSYLKSLDLIRTIAKEINNPVNLVDPKWIILIEVLGNVTGIAVLQRDQIFSSILEKREIRATSDNPIFD
jgi:tRNA acetyltransferase TAN1